MSAETLKTVDERIEKMRHNNDIFAYVRQKLLDEDQNKFPKIPKDLDTNFEKHGGWTGAVSGATAGAALGAHVTIATMGTGLVATVPLAVIGGIIGYFGGAKAGSKVKKD